MSFANKYRPKTLDMVVGQDAAVKTMKAWKEVPHAILFVGDSGCGKTTLARIAAFKLIGVDESDFIEKNCADFNGIEMAREVRRQCKQKGMVTDKRAWLIDEAHRMTPEAQDALLKTIEDHNKHSYFLFGTTDPEKLRTAFKNRCTTVKVRLLKDNEMIGLINRVLKKEKAKLHGSVIERIVEVSEGSPRRALVNIESVIGLDSKKEQLEALYNSDAKAKAYDLAKELIFQRPNIRSIKSKLRDLEEEPEKVRRIIIGLANTILLSDKTNDYVTKKCANIINLFRDPYFDPGSGKALLSLNCFEAVNLR